MNHLIAARAPTVEPRLGTRSMLGVYRLGREILRAIGRAVCIGCYLLLSLWAILVLLFWLLVAISAIRRGSR